MSSHLILELDNQLRRCLQQTTIDNLDQCFALVRRIHNEFQPNENDSLYVPTILILRQYSRFQHSNLFDKILEEFISLFSLIPICSKKILDDFLGVISVILTKRIVPSNDEVQQDLFVRFLHAFIRTVRSNEQFYFKEFIGNFNQNLPIIGHFLSCLLQLYERIHTLDYRIHLIETISCLFALDQPRQDLIGQILACFLPGILKSISQDLSSVHHRLIELDLKFLISIIRLTIQQTPKSSYPIKPELADLLVERNVQWLNIVDQHLIGLVQRFSQDFLHHENVDIQRIFGHFCLSILVYTSQWLKQTSYLSLKTLFVLLPSIPQFEVLLQKLFNCQQTNIDSSSYLPFELEILESNQLTLSTDLLRQCQLDLFQLFNTQQDRRYHLRLFLGYYRFIRQSIDHLFSMEIFIDKFFRFLSNSIDLQFIHRNNLKLLNQTSRDSQQYEMIHQSMKCDVHDEIQQICRLTNEFFRDYILEQIDRTNIFTEMNSKIFYLLSLIDRDLSIDEYQRLVDLFDRMLSLPKKSFRNISISHRNLTIYYLVDCLRHLTNRSNIEYFIDFIPLVLLCHSSIYTIRRQTSDFCLRQLTDNQLDEFLRIHSEYIIDKSLRMLSNNNGYFILIEFVRLGGQQVVNQPIMTHVIEQYLLELSSLPSIESVELIFQFLKIFSQQLTDIVDTPKPIKSKPTNSLIEFALNLQKQYQIPNDEPSEADEQQKQQHPWHSMLISIVDVFQHFISHSNVHIRCYVLDALPCLARLLSQIDENLFLPLVHKIWPGLIHRFHEKDFNIRRRCLVVLECLTELCSDFVDRRIRTDILPILIQQLESNRLISSNYSLEYRYTKLLLSSLSTILLRLTLDFEQIEVIILQLLFYLQNETFASMACQQLTNLTSKYADLIWLQLMLHDENEYRTSRLSHRMKVYQPSPMLNIDSKWKHLLFVV